MKTPELSLSTVGGDSEKAAVYNSGSRFFPDTEPVSALILGFPASRTVGNKCLLLKPPHQVFCYSSPSQAYQATHTSAPSTPRIT